MQGRPRLDDLIALARANADSDDPIDELAAAASLKADLDELTDAVLGHFVDQARRAGCSWTQIGAALGVTKQAAQQRHASTESIARRLLSSLVSKVQVGARFTPRAKAAVVAAQEAARALGHDYIGTEHLLLGLYADEEAIGPKVLLEVGVRRADVEGYVLELVGRGDGSGGHLAFTPRATKAMELSLREAVALGHNYIGTEHLLLGLLREGDGLAATFLAERGMGHDAARAAIVRLLAAHVAKPAGG